MDRDIGFYAPESAPILGKAFRKVFESGEPYYFELEFIRLNGERIWVQTCGNPVIVTRKVVRVSGCFSHQIEALPFRVLLIGQHQDSFPMACAVRRWLTTGCRQTPATTAWG